MDTSFCLLKHHDDKMRMADDKENDSFCVVCIIGRSKSGDANGGL